MLVFGLTDYFSSDDEYNEHASGSALQISSEAQCSSMLVFRAITTHLYQSLPPTEQVSQVARFLSR